MITVTKTINHFVFIGKAENYLKVQIESLIDLIGNIDGSMLKDNFKIQVGWSIFILKKFDNVFTIWSPDYNKNPLTDIIDDLTISLWIQLEQGMLLKDLALEGQQISYKDKIICTKDALNNEDIYLERAGVYEEKDSGWYIGTYNECDSDNILEAYYAYELIRLRPSLIKVLALPNGYMAVFHKDKLVSVINSKNEELYTSTI